ncbi:MAG: helix-turn-helix transcriptional regulator [Lachnospiraceae bacterium]|nr:helix-turn-helix transcriptional regulator [Lachnospiraceae bacterium]
MSTIGENIKNLRIKQNLTQKELAEHLNVTSSTLSRWENGSRIPSKEDIDNVAEFFCVSYTSICPKDTISFRKSRVKVAICVLVFTLAAIGGALAYRYYSRFNYKLIKTEAGINNYDDSALFFHYLLPPRYTEDSWDAFCLKLQTKYSDFGNSEYESYVFYFYLNEKDVNNAEFELMYMIRQP